MSLSSKLDLLNARLIQLRRLAGYARDQEMASRIECMAEEVEAKIVRLSATDRKS